MEGIPVLIFIFSKNTGVKIQIDLACKTLNKPVSGSISRKPMVYFPDSNHNAVKMFRTEKDGDDCIA